MYNKMSFVSSLSFNTKAHPKCLGTFATIRLVKNASGINVFNSTNFSSYNMTWWEVTLFL